MNRNAISTIFFPLLDKTTNDPVTTGSPAAYIGSGSSTAATSNSVSYVSNGIWKLTLTATETNVASLGVLVTLAGAKPYSQQFFPAVAYATVSQVPVPNSRTAVLKKSATGLIATFPETMRVGESKILAIDFKNDMPVNGRVFSISSVALESGTTGGITFTAADADVDREQVKLLVTAVTAGTYVIDVTVAYSPNSELSSGHVTLAVAG